jgi:hypothetical protein
VAEEGTMKNASVSDPATPSTAPKKELIECAFGCAFPPGPFQGNYHAANEQAKKII